MRKPMIVGGLMGLMMLWMLHGAITGDGALGAMALIGFLGAHVVVLLIGLGVVVFAGRLSPRMRGWMDRLHKPSLRHVGAMLGVAIAVIGVVHLTAHGFGGV